MDSFAYCDDCKEPIKLSELGGGNHFYHCGKCEEDLCPQCYENRKVNPPPPLQNPLECEKGHIMERLFYKPMRYLSKKGKYFSSCMDCKSGLSEAKVITTGFYHCETCEVDRCCSCFVYMQDNPGANQGPVNHEASLIDQPKEEARMKCSNGHKLKNYFIKPLAYQYIKKEAYGKCAECMNAITGTRTAEEGIYHCASCEEDYCANCYSEKVNPQQPIQVQPKPVAKPPLPKKEEKKNA